MVSPKYLRPLAARSAMEVSLNRFLPLAKC
jgi:hypothetical protein